MTILVTGAAGKTGKAVIRRLAARGVVVRALVRAFEQAPAMHALGVVGVVVGDMLDPAVWAGATPGADAIYHICPNMHPRETEIGRLALTAARDAGIEHFVYHSVLHPQTQEMPHHWNKLLVEEQILAAGIPYTILQPGAYMQNIQAAWQTITTQGIYRVPYGVETRMSIVDLEDVAEVAARVLTTEGHRGATYELAGPQALSQLEMAAILSRVLQRPVRAEAISLDVWEGEARAANLSDYAVETLLAMFRSYQRHGFCGNSRVLNWLLGRQSTTFEAVARRFAGQQR